MKRKNRIYRKWSNLSREEKERFIYACNNDSHAIHGIGTEKDWHKRFTTKSGKKLTLEESIPLEIDTDGSFKKLIICPAYSGPVPKDPKERKKVWARFEKMREEETILLDDLTVWESTPSKRELEEMWNFIQERGEPGDWEKQFVFQPAPKME
jgi:hypothetical protein